MNLLIVCPKGRGALDALSTHFRFSHGVDVGKKWIGVVEPSSYDAIDALTNSVDVIVLPVSTDATPIDPATLAHFAHVAGITGSETTFSLRRKLHHHHGFPPFRPEYDGPLG
jgi:hypothetical protein